MEEDEWRDKVESLHEICENFKSLSCSDDPSTGSDNEEDESGDEHSEESDDTDEDSD